MTFFTTVVRMGMVIVLGCAGSASLQAQERTLQRSQLPAVVQATIDRESQGATVKKFATEKEHGRRVYEAETIVQGHTRDLQVAEDGTLTEVEEEVPFESLSEPVKAALTTKAAGAKITKVESLTKGGKLVAYEAATLRGTTRGEVQVGPDGGKLAHAE